MKTILQILEELKKKHNCVFAEVPERIAIDKWGKKDVDAFWNDIESALTQILDELPDDKSLEDKSNGRYNREMELRDCIKKLKGDI